MGPGLLSGPAPPPAPGRTSLTGALCRRPFGPASLCGAPVCSERGAAWRPGLPWASLSGGWRLPLGSGGHSSAARPGPANTWGPCTAPGGFLKSLGPVPCWGPARGRGRGVRPGLAPHRGAAGGGAAPGAACLTPSLSSTLKLWDYSKGKVSGRETPRWGGAWTGGGGGGTWAAAPWRGLGAGFPGTWGWFTDSRGLDHARGSVPWPRGPCRGRPGGLPVPACRPGTACGRQPPGL